jgi:hypothetical protein
MPWESEVPTHKEFNEWSKRAGRWLGLWLLFDAVIAGFVIVLILWLPA